MSRRDSRASLNARQNDALVEFENFKKKFLLANKHITKLNSTLSVRIEELNAQISTLYVENLRLRAVEISLMGQLKREREKSRRVMADAEAATLNHMKHLGYLRQSLNIKPEPTPPSSPTSPRAKPRRQPSPLSSTNNPLSASPPGPGLRISKPPNVPGINEEDEPCSELEVIESETEPPLQSEKSTKRKSSTKTRISNVSKLAAARETSPPVPPSDGSIMYTTIPAPTKRKSSRRLSGLLTIDAHAHAPTPRPASPAFGSPIRLQAGLAEIEDENAIISGGRKLENDPRMAEGDDDLGPDLEEPPPPPPKKEREKRKSRTKEPQVEVEKDPIDLARPRERKRPREEDEHEVDRIAKTDEGHERDRNLLEEGTMGKLKDVTNSRYALQPINTNNYYGSLMDTIADASRHRSSQLLDLGLEQGRERNKGKEDRSEIQTIITPKRLPSQIQHQPEPSAGLEGRERRVRKSINYAEPKLNTKMRKPDPPPGAELQRAKKRSSTNNKAQPLPPSETTAKEAISTTQMQVISRSSVFSATAAAEFALRNAQGHPIDPELLPIPRRSSIALSHSPISVSRNQAEVADAAGTSPYSTSHSPEITASTGRRKSHQATYTYSDDSNPEEEGSDEMHADEEYIPTGKLSGWINVEGRRRIGSKNEAGGTTDEKRKIKRSSMVLLGAAESRPPKREAEDREGRRRSTAV